jgi:hypothetical protein
MLAEARKKRGTAMGKKATAKKAASTRGADRQTPGTPNNSLKRDNQRDALPPGRRTSKSGNVYSERRRDRSDKPGQLSLGSRDRDYIEDIGDRILNDYGTDIDFGDAFNEIIDSYEVYYAKQWKVVNDLAYYVWDDNDLGIQPKNVGEVMYLALYNLYGDVERYVEKNK